MDSEQDSTDEQLPDLDEAGAGGVGAVLRAARQEKRLELSHIAGETRIPIRHLEAIEEGRFDTLPSRTYAIGFAKNFARAVGLDQDSIASAVREELSDAGGLAYATAGGVETGDPAKLPSSGLAWFGGIAALIFAVGLIFFYNTYFGAGTGPASLLADATEEASDDAASLAAAAGDDAEASETAAPSANGQVVFTALEDGVWVRFYEDGGDRLFEATMATGDRFELPTDASEPRINTGRPDAFSITIGGRSVPKLADEPVTMGDTPISAAALLARASNGAAPSSN